MRVGGGVEAGVGGLPDLEVGRCGGGGQGESRGVQGGEGEALVDEGVVDADRLRVREAGGAQDAEDGLDGGDLVGAAGGAVGGEQRGLRVGLVTGVDAQADGAQVGPPVPGGLPAVLGPADELVGDGEQQVVGAVEVAVDRARVGAERGAEPPYGERLGAVLPDQPDRGVDDQFGGEDDALLGGAPPPPLRFRDYAIAHPGRLCQAS